MSWQQARRCVTAVLRLSVALPLLLVALLLYGVAWLLEAIADRRARRHGSRFFLPQELPRQHLSLQHRRGPRGRLTPAWAIWALGLAAALCAATPLRAQPALIPSTAFVQAVGRQSGSRRQTQIALRLEHFSNAGIAHPNPGENFVQLRIAYRLR